MKNMIFLAPQTSARFLPRRQLKSGNSPQTTTIPFSPGPKPAICLDQVALAVERSFSGGVLTLSLPTGLLSPSPNFSLKQCYYPFKPIGTLKSHMTSLLVILSKKVHNLFQLKFIFYLT